MYSRKKQGHKINRWESQPLIRHFREMLSIWNHTKLIVGEKWRTKDENLTGNSVRLRFAPKISISNPPKSLCFIKAYSCKHSTKHIDSPTNCISYNWQQVSNDTRDISNHNGNQKLISGDDQQVFTCKLINDFTSNRKEAYVAVVFSHKPLPIFSNTGKRDETSEQSLRNNPKEQDYDHLIWVEQLTIFVGR